MLCINKNYKILHEKSPNYLRQIFSTHPFPLEKKDITLSVKSEIAPNIYLVDIISNLGNIYDRTIILEDDEKGRRVLVKKDWVDVYTPIGYIDPYE